MPEFILQSVNPRGDVAHAIGVPAADLVEAHALARRFAASLAAAAPDGKSWSGWSVEILDPFGRYALSVPMPIPSAARPAGSSPDMAA